MKADLLKDTRPPCNKALLIHNSPEYTEKSSQSDDFMRYVPEVTGLERTYDEYDRYEDVFDANSDEYLVNKGARIIRSEITITDSQGRNKRLVRRHNDNNYQKWNKDYNIHRGRQSIPF
jgi:hypothetical protein